MPGSRSPSPACDWETEADGGHRSRRRHHLDHDGNAKAAAVRPAMERRWDDALASFDSRTEIGVLGVQGRADTVEELSELMVSRGVTPRGWYGVWLFVDC
jgi:hypothetical protein